MSNRLPTSGFSRLVASGPSHPPVHPVAILGNVRHVPNIRSTPSVPSISSGSSIPSILFISSILTILSISSVGCCADPPEGNADDESAATCGAPAAPLDAGRTDAVQFDPDASFPSELPQPRQLGLWLDAESIAQSGPVSRWPDRSGYHLDFAVPGNGTPRPTLVTDAVSGHPAVRFTGEGETLRTEDCGGEFVRAETATVFAVFKNREGGHVGQLLSSCCVGNNQIRLYGSPTSLYLHASGYYRDEHVDDLSVPTTDWQLLTLVLGDQRIRVFQNGRRVATVDVDRRAGTWEFNQVGNRCSASEKLHADLAELLVYRTALTTERRGWVEEYLLRQYDL
ncbi:MAG: LamG-like jellyroll fold domain-containing protein [Bradymonadaceae bacterium]